jgi:hypothetical protein
VCGAGGDLALYRLDTAWSTSSTIQAKTIYNTVYLTDLVGTLISLGGGIHSHPIDKCVHLNFIASFDILLCLISNIIHVYLSYLYKSAYG